MLRRFTNRILIPLPTKEGRKKLFINLLKKSTNELTDAHLEKLADKTEGYSGSDITNLCKQAAFNSIRQFSIEQLSSMSSENVSMKTLLSF